MNWQSGNNYSHKDMARMQQEALERVKDMQERSRMVVEQSNIPPVYPGFAKTPPVEAHTQQVNHIHGQQQEVQVPQSKPTGLLGGLFGAGNPLASLMGGSGGEGPISRALDALGIDNDKIIILVLLFVLINNQADKKLILALCYILL